MNAADIAEMLAERIESLATALVGSGPTSSHGDEQRYFPKGGLAIAVRGRRRGIWCDYAAGEVGGDALDLVQHLRGGSMKEALKWARSWLGEPDTRSEHRRPSAISRPQDDAADRARSLELCRRIWSEALAPAGSPVEAYLLARGCYLPRGGAIRWHPACPREKERHPAMLSLMTRPLTAEPCGLHRTFIRRDGSGKADGTAKAMLGAAGIIRLTPDEDVGLGLGLSEGVETGLAIMRHSGWAPIWATASAPGMRKFPVLAGVEALTLFADQDDGGAGIAAARECGRIWTAAGREVVIESPPPGLDWNDVATGRAA